MRLTQPFIRLPFGFDAARLAEEVAALPDSAWMPHPGGQPGNSAVALISRNGGDNDDFVGPMAATPHLDACPYHRQVMAEFGEVLARSRLMKLDAGSEVGLHVDFNYHWHTRVRIHVPVITHPRVEFRCGDQQVHMAAGQCWLFDNWRPHNVVNAGARERIHLVIDLAGSSRFWRQVECVQTLDPQADAAAIDGLVREVPYRPERTVTLLTERYNSAPVMVPGEVDALVAGVIDDLTRHPDNDAALLAGYRRLLDDFARDWRELWLRYGMSRDGFPHYRRLIDRTAAQLHPDRRALCMASNGVGANPVIMQRILRAALAPDALQPFLSPASGADHSA